LQEAANADVEVVTWKAPKDGKYDVLFPVCLPDEGTFEWLDFFLASNPQYTELSDRKLFDWAMRSGLWRPKNNRSSNDRPDMNLGIPQLDDGSVKSLLAIAAASQRRPMIIMEVKGNLTKKDRIDMVKNFRVPHFRKVAWVMVGDPDDKFKVHTVERALQDKQAAAMAAFEARKVEKARQKQFREQQRKLEIAKKRAERIRQLAEEKAAKAAEDSAKGLETAEDVEMKEGEGEGAAAEKAPEPAAQAEVKEDEIPDEEMEVDEEPEEVEEEPPKVVLTDDEKHDWFRKSTPVPDIVPSTMSATFSTFTFPDKDEGFDQLDYKWKNAAESEAYLRQWTLERKVTTRIEDLQPSDYFREKLQKWQKDLQGWHSKHMEFKDPAKRAALFSAKRASVAKASEEARLKKEVAAKGKKKDSEAKKDDKEAEAEAMKALEEELERQEIDVFGVEDINDIAHGEPLFFNFAYEDWTLLGLRFELHLLCHSFKNDCNDKDRTAFAPEHLGFYYTKYFKKSLISRNFSQEKIEDLLDMVKDTIAQVGKVIEPQITDDLETNDVFVKLTEESRRERQRRIDSGDESAKLQFVVVAQASQQPALGASAKSKSVSQHPGVYPGVPNMGMTGGKGFDKGCGKMVMPKIQRPVFASKAQFVPPGSDGGWGDGGGGGGGGGYQQKGYGKSSGKGKKGKSGGGYNSKGGSYW